MKRDVTTMKTTTTTTASQVEKSVELNRLVIVEKHVQLGRKEDEDRGNNNNSQIR